MKKVVFFIAGVLIIFAACQQSPKQQETMSKNPLLQDFDTRFEVPPFEEIKTSHYLPAIKKAIEAHNSEVKAIAEQEAEPDFENTIAALDYSGMLLDRVTSVFYNMTSANTSDELQKVAQKVSPLLSGHRDNIRLNADLFARIKTVYNKKEKLDM